jgi:hemerythrin
MVKRLRDRLSIGDKEALCFEAINVLKTWLFNHIQGSDKRYAQYLNAHGIK